MHELSLMEEVRRQALGAAEAQGARRIEAITLRVGELAGVDAEALRFAFPVVMQGTIAEGAALTVDHEPVHCQCGPCGAAFAPRNGCWDCPRCGRFSAEVISGKDLRLVSLQVS